MLLALPSLVLALLPLAQALPQITRQGRYLYADGSRFTFKGIAYQEPGAIAENTAENEANGGFPEPESYVDPLSDVARCEANLPNLQSLGVNSIRVYSASFQRLHHCLAEFDLVLSLDVNPAVDHSGCMDAFDAAGIYVLADLGLPMNGEHVYKQRLIMLIPC